MTSPNMAAITASVERSLQNFSLDDSSSNQRRVFMGGSSEGIKSSSSSSSTSDDHATAENHFSISDTSLELNSHLSLPYQWEQCLDLKTGEIYYINWMTGMKSKEDPRLSEEYMNGDFYSEDENSSYNSEESSSESCSRGNHLNNINNYKKEENVLVVAGCKSCLMYYMVPKQVEDCPKCTGQLLHFDRFENGSS